MPTEQPPTRWDLSNVYPGLGSPEFQQDFEKLGKEIKQLAGLLDAAQDRTLADAPVAELQRIVAGLVEHLNALYTLSDTLRVYIYSYVATDSFNNEAKRRLSQYEQVGVRLQQQQVRMHSLIGKLAGQLPEILQDQGVAQAHAFNLLEMAEQSRYLMSEPEESLAAELSLSGAGAWNKLQGTITSQLSVDFELDGEVHPLPTPALINLRAHTSESVRCKAYEKELEIWESVKEPLAAALNGVKGSVLTLDRRRGREDALHSAIDDARIDRTTLEAMLAAMEASFPVFRRYFKAKAARFDQQQLPWWNIFAPTGRQERRFGFGEARQFILDNFSGFTPDLADLAQQAFDNNWIDAEQRTGKRGGAFCMAVPAVKESRILCNFDGSLDTVFTIAHELGHAYHNHCAFQAGKTYMQRILPMTLAETASIMCETIVQQAVLAEVRDPQEELAILEAGLISDSQVIVDIYSRYLFEKEVYERRQQSELSAEELCEIMVTAQKATYGDGLDEKHLHPYMWTWKPHYYYPGLSFYNFPYAFGLLFGIGLYAIYQQRGPAFIPDYQALLATTGEGNAADLASRFGIDIHQQSFWETSLGVIARRVERYEQL